MKRTAMNHTKMKRLCRELKVPLYQAVGILESIWHLTAREAPAGNIGKLSDEDIASWLEWKRTAADLTDGLVNSNWLDRHDEHRLIIHDWHEHSDDAVDNQLARSLQRYANGALPRMKRLSKQERDFLCAQMHTPCAQNATEAPAVRTETHKKPLPVPVPVPVPVPEPVAWAGSMISTAVLTETGLSGQDLARNLSEVGQSELRKGKDGRQLVDELTSAVNAYQVAQAEGKLSQYAVGVEKFIGTGLWRDPKLWRWKEGHGPPKATAPRVDFLAEVKAQRATTQKDHDAIGSSE